MCVENFIKSLYPDIDPDAEFVGFRERNVDEDEDMWCTHMLYMYDEKIS